MLDEGIGQHVEPTRPAVVKPPAGGGASWMWKRIVAIGVLSSVACVALAVIGSSLSPPTLDKSIRTTSTPQAAPKLVLRDYKPPTRPTQAQPEPVTEPAPVTTEYVVIVSPVPIRATAMPGAEVVGQALKGDVYELYKETPSDYLICPFGADRFIRKSAARAAPFVKSTLSEDVKRLAFFSPDLRFSCGTFTHPSRRHALISAGSARGTPPEWVTPCG
jgi:hypothetical protein